MAAVSPALILQGWIVDIRVVRVRLRPDLGHQILVAQCRLRAPLPRLSAIGRQGPAEPGPQHIHARPRDPPRLAHHRQRVGPVRRRTHPSKRFKSFLSSSLYPLFSRSSACNSIRIVISPSFARVRISSPPGRLFPFSPCWPRLPGTPAASAALRQYVQDRLAGGIVAPNGATVRGPAVPWKGRRHGRRQPRRWGRAWSPAQIAHRLPRDFPDDPTMRISHEAIYQALYVQGRGALRRDLTACLRTGRTLRVPRARTRSRGKGFVTSELLISERPAEADDRAVPGHWEGDLILGLGSSAIGTLVERTTRFTLLLHLPRMTDHGRGPRANNGPALAGHGAEAVREAITSAVTVLPEQLWRSLAWDQGAEMAQHARLRIDTGLQIYFCDPQSPWQRGTNENTNGLLRQYFPKGTDLSVHSASDLGAVALTLNTRPRKTLGWRTPAEALNELLRSNQTQSVATTA